MGSMLVGLYGVFLMLVALHGNGAVLLSSIAQEGDFFPWIIALLVLAALNDMQSTHDFVAPFIALAIVSTLVSRWDEVSRQLLDAYQFMRRNPLPGGP